MALDLKALTTAIKQGEIDTVIVAFPDTVGRLVGKRFTGKHFLSQAATSGTHACNYLLTVDIEMEPQTGFALANWEQGFGDFELRPDFSTLRRLPWQPATALLICDCAHPESNWVPEAPRSVLRTQLAKASQLGYTPYAATELEFFLLNQSYHAAAVAHYEGLTPSSDYRIDYHTMQPTRDEALMRQIRNQMDEAGIAIESSKGEWGRGQHELNFVYDQVLPMADGHTIFKQGVKEIAAQHERCVTFMPKPWANEVGSSCHIHFSLWKGSVNRFWDKKSKTGSSLFRQFLGGVLKYSPELCYFYAPTVNAYKRYQVGSWAPTKMAWSYDNRTVGFRVVGSGQGFRFENRMPGADANPYLAFSAMLAAGMAGIEEALDCGDDYQGNAYTDDRLPALPRSLHDAASRLKKSEFARRSFGDAVVDFYAHTAELEAAAYASAVTDWERTRYFEQI